MHAEFYVVQPPSSCVARLSSTENQGNDVCQNALLWPAPAAQILRKQTSSSSRPVPLPRGILFDIARLR